MAAQNVLNRDEQNRVAALRSTLRNSKENAAQGLEQFRQLIPPETTALDAGSTFAMQENGTSKSRNSINQIRDLIRKGALSASITPQAGLNVDEASAPTNFLKGKDRDTQIT